MPNLKTTLSNLDPGFLRIVADFWGIEEKIPITNLVKNLMEAMTDDSQFDEMWETLPNQARQAWLELSKKNGKISWSDFIRHYGDINEIGQGKIERERKYLKKGTTTEYLWYRGLLFRAFFKDKGEPQEFAYLPDEFILLLKKSIPPTVSTASPGKPFHFSYAPKLVAANDHILDHACTLLAALRAGLDAEKSCHFNIPVHFLIELLKSADIVDEAHQPKTGETKRFLETGRAQGLLQLFICWEKSETINELFLIPEIKCEGKWKNQPKTARENLLKMVKEIPIQEWWDLDAFIADVRQQQPDFLRPSGDYDSWIIRNRSSGEYLRGFANWDKVEGHFIRHLITQWLRWLGAVDLGFSEDSETIQAFRLTTWSKFLFNHQFVPNLAKENEKVIIRSNGSILCPPLTPRAVRYQIARFCEWREEKIDGYHYFLSASAMQKAEMQNLQTGQLITFFKRNARMPIPPTFYKAITQWKQFHLQAKFETGVLLKVTDASILDELEKSSAKRFLLERVNPTMMLVKPGGEKVIQHTLMEIGYLSDKPMNL